MKSSLIREPDHELVYDWVPYQHKFNLFRVVKREDPAGFCMKFGPRGGAQVVQTVENRNLLMKEILALFAFLQPSISS